jgi:2'-5' RNA ligase
MPRLFTGLEVPPDVGQHLALLRGGLAGARWVDPENYHVTLRFIGDIDHATAQEIFASLGERKRREPIEIAIEELSTFGGGKPRAVLAKVKASRELVELQLEQERLMRRLGLPPETRKFVPHVTLARLRETSPHEVAHYLTSRSYGARHRFVANRFVLYSSRDSVGGGPYVVEAAYPLG